MDFLLDIAREVRPLAQAEVRLMEEAKAQELSSRSSGVSDTSVQEWDVPRYKTLLRKRCIGMEPSDFADYFGLNNVLSGLEAIVRETFGVSMTRVPIARDEAWTGEWFPLALTLCE